MEKRNAKEIITEFHSILDNSDEESTVQRFLESHPFILTKGYVPEGRCVISQFPLGADFRVDFAYVLLLNRGTFLNFIEIESPKLKVFTESDEFTQSYNHAFQQIQDWYQWCLSNQQYLANMLIQVLDFTPLRLMPTPNFTLIAGRRNELSNPKRRKRFSARANTLNRGVDVATYDDLIDSVGIATYGVLDYINVGINCVSYKKEGLHRK